ncbi:hypothetical protein PN627_14810 [Parabacteroides distasonis]|nr:hypothetical protein [Parabacteroides distasonis]
MEKGTTPEPTPEYKKAKYFLTVSVKDEAGKILPLRLPVMRRRSLKLLFLRLRIKRRPRVTVIHST